MPISEEVLRKISEYAIHMDWDIAFDGKSKGNRHLFRVKRLALHLNGIEGGEGDIVVAGAWLHDVGLVEGNKGHCFKGGKIAKTFLAELDLDQETIMKIVHCVEAHDGEIEAKSMEAKVVHDSDTVDKMGPLGIIRHGWKMANVDYHDYTASLTVNQIPISQTCVSPIFECNYYTTVSKIGYTVSELLEFLPRHLAERRANLYLDSAVAIVNRYEPAVEEFFADEVFARKVLNEVVGHARAGIPTEEVVKRLFTKHWMKEDFAGVLEEQVHLGFL